MGESNRTAYGRALAELADKDPMVVALDGDVSGSTNTIQLGKKYPERFFNVGVAEQNEVGIAAGLAVSGFKPYVSTFATFASMRACDPIRQSLAYGKLNVKVVATNAGIENNGDGVTHQAIEDIAIMRAMPNMMVVCTSDPVSTHKAIYALYNTTGPAYMRLGRYESELIYNEDMDFQLGKMIRLRDGKDLTIIATGRMVYEAAKAAEELAAKGLDCRVLDCHTIKPIDKEEIIKAAKETKGIITAEDHSIIGGLGGAVCEVVCESCPAWVERIGVMDTFARSSRDYRQLYERYGLTAEHIVKKALEMAEK